MGQGDMGNSGLTSVVICAYSLDRWADLCAAVRSCTTQTRRPDGVVVVVDHNDELCHRATRELGGVTVVANRSTQGLSGARNTGVSVVGAGTVAFLDDDAVADPTWLEHLTAPLHDPAVAGVGGWVVPRFESPPPVWFPEEFNWVVGCSYPGLPPSGATVRNPIGANMAVRAEVFESVGGFRTGLGRIGRTPLGCEETELCIRYTARNPDRRFVMARDARVLHRVTASRLTWHYFLTRCWAEGRSKATVSSLVGSTSGLAAERRYLSHTLPRAFGRRVRLVARHPVRATGQVVAMVVGTAGTVAGWWWGRLALRAEPRRRDMVAGVD